MIKYNYEMLRIHNESGKIIRLIPNLYSKELNNIIYLEGPNSSGKSTLLNLIALCCHGLSNDNIGRSLKVQMNDLMNIKIQKMSFNMEISNRDKSIILRASKKKDDIEITIEESINGEEPEYISNDRFNRKYNLIYDIPINQRDRMYDLLTGLNNEQINFALKVKLFWEYLRSISKDIKDARDPERIEELSSLNKKFQKENGILGEIIPTKQKVINELYRYYYMRMYCKYINNYDHITSEINEYESQKIQLFTSHTKISKSYTTLKNKINNKIYELQEIKDRTGNLLINILFKNKEQANQWNEISLWDTSKYKLDNRLKTLCTKYIDECDSFMLKIEQQPNFDSALKFIEIIHQLEGYSNVDINISNLNMNMKQLISILISESKKYEEFLQRYNNYRIVKENLYEIRKIVDRTDELLKELKSIREEENIISEDINGYKIDIKDINILKEEQKSYERELDYYKLKCIDCNVDITRTIPEIMASFNNIPSLVPYYSLDDNQIKNEIEELKNEVDKDKETIKINEVLIQNNTNDLKKLNGMKPHEYENYKELINELIKKLPKLQDTISNDYRKLLDQLINNKEHPINIEKSKQNEIEYYEKVAKYLAQLVGKFYYLDGLCEPTKIDLINSIIYTKEGIIVPLNLQGTGHGQATYLMGLLNTQDKRIIIALFDEIGSIDLKTLENTVFKKIKELYIENKLLIGCLVHKRDIKEPNIINLESY